MNREITNVRINGGIPLAGSIRIVPNKNAILPALIASLLTDDEMTYTNVPINSPDVQKVLAILKHLGATVEDNTATVMICCKDVTGYELSQLDVKDMQAGYLFAGALLARFGKAVIPIASGCGLGYRGPEGHMEYLSQLGVKHSTDGNKLLFELNESIRDDELVQLGKLSYKERSVVYLQPKVTPTENILMLLAKTSKYRTKVSGIAQEPHVLQLIETLKHMGVSVSGEGSVLEIVGSDTLKGVRFHAEPDHIDYFGSCIVATMTKSDLNIVVDRFAPGIIHMNRFVQQLGIKIEPVENGFKVLGSISKYAPDDTFPKDHKNNGGIVYLVNPGPWPAFPVDALPSLVALSALNAKPNTFTLVNNWMYTDGLRYVPMLEQMGAPIKQQDSQRVIIGSTLSGNPFAGKSTFVESPNIIEGTRCIVYCGLAGGTHTINNAQYIFRRNPDFFKLHKELGANIDVFSVLAEEENGRS